MQFNGNSGNNREAVNVNTRGIQLMNRDGFFPSTILIGYWNEMISLKFHPPLEKSKQTEKQFFDYDKVVNTALTLEKAVILLEMVQEYVIPAIKANQETFKGVPIGGDSLIGVGTKLVDGRLASYIALYKSLNETTRKPEVAIWYEFKQSSTIDNYDPTTGAFETTKGVHGELMLFAKLIKAATIGLSNATAHAGRTVDKYFRERVEGTINEIAGKHGVQTSGRSGGGYQKRSDIFSGGGSSKGSNTSNEDLPDFDAPMSSMENISDIDAFMQ